MSRQCLPDFVLPDPRHRSIVLGGVALDGDLGRHPSHREGAALVADVYQSIDVRPEQGGVGHGQVGSIGSDLIAVALELLYVREEVIPPAAVQPERVVAELVQDLLHLERRRDRLQEDRRPDRARRDAEVALRRSEDIVPQPGLEVVLQLREVEVRPGSLLEQCVHVVEEVQAEVEQPARRHAPVDGHVRLVEVPPPRPDE